MPKVQVWKCPHTSYLFEHEVEYRRHLKRLSRERVARRKWEAIQDSLDGVIAGIQKVTSGQEALDYMWKHQDKFVLYGMMNKSFDGSAIRDAMAAGHTIILPKLRHLKIDKGRWEKTVSNSHNCPRDGQTNWGGRAGDDVPRGYPGWRGGIRAEYDEDAVVKVRIPNAKRRKQKIYEVPSISDICGGFGADRSLSGLNTGSGGGRNPSRSELFVYLQDFPHWQEQIDAILKAEEQKQIIAKLSNKFYRFDSTALDGLINGEVGKSKYKDDD